ncbi:MAG TPA: DUF1800 domain-containing protein [Gemmatimonadaceae bacterium]|nr:DUF1800 domain-containing protein [Gemmatimonadaceae bacterium]
MSVPRTYFPTGGLVCAIALGSALAVGTSAGADRRELSDSEQAIHVLNRLAFGPRPGDVERVLAEGVDKWIARQLQPERIPDQWSERLERAFPLAFKNAAELLRDYPPPGIQLQARRVMGDSTMSSQDSAMLAESARRGREFVQQLQAIKVARAVASERQLLEVMVDFWENHFNVFIGKNQVRYYLPDYTRDVIRPHALGKFRELLGAVAKSPAMLVYLDNAQSVADSGQPTLGRGGRPGGGRVGGAAVRRRLARLDPAQRAALEQLQQRRPRGLNENYARELMELHTLGVDGGYTQRDVVEVARALTGWGIAPPRSGRVEFAFRPELHDAGEKVVLGHRLPAGRGIEDGEQVLDILSKHPSTARFIARKLAVRFVSDSPPAELVERAATVFTRTGGDIREVVRTIVTSPEFFSRSAFRAKVKSPFEFVVSAVRALGGVPDTSALTANLVARLGQPLYGHQAPNGWPETGAAWMNTGAILNRINFGLLVATGRFPGVSFSSLAWFDSLRTAPRQVQVDRVVATVLQGAASPETRDILVSGRNPLLGASPDSGRRALLAGITSDSAGRMPAAGRVAAGSAGRAGGRGFAMLARAPAPEGLGQVIGLAIGSPEFQRR